MPPQGFGLRTSVRETRGLRWSHLLLTAALSVALTWFAKDSVVSWWARALVELSEQTSERLRSLRVNHVNFDGLALRSGPGEHFSAVSRMERFTTVHWIAWSDENWVNVRTNGGEIGYVNLEFLADGSGDDARADWCSRPAENRANGSVLQQSKFGEHILRVRNGNDDDALVRLKSLAGESVALLYV